MPEPPKRAYEIAAATISEREYVNFMTKFMQVLQRDTVVKCYVCMQASTKTIQFLKLFGLLTYCSEVPKNETTTFERIRSLINPHPPKKFFKYNFFKHKKVD